MRRRILITGGAGFIGTNLAHRLLSAGETVHILDNISSPNVIRNLEWLLETHPEGPVVHVEDIRNPVALRRLINDVDHVFHLAAQTAVTTSVADPRTDFQVNALGTLNLLEEIRQANRPPSIIFASTTRVYGALDHVELRTERKRYVRPDFPNGGFSEGEPLNFCSPHGCSKGAAEQYALDYHLTYGIRSVVFRMSSVYGPHQYGSEDQGWVAHITSHAAQKKPITVYGDGRQVRDLLFVDDLIDAFLLAGANMDRISGEAFNIGGGPGNTMSPLELIELLQSFGVRPQVDFAEWRNGDQKYYVSDTRKFRVRTGWTPRTNVRDGVATLRQWLNDTYAVGQEAAMEKAS